MQPCPGWRLGHGSCVNALPASLPRHTQPVAGKGLHSCHLCGQCQHLWVMMVVVVVAAFKQWARS